jgi:O-antigen ligase
MGARTLSAAHAHESGLAAALVALLGCATVIMLAGIAMDDVPVTVAGGAALGAVLVALVAADWLSGLYVIALSLPLPAVYDTGDLRIATAAPVTAAVLLGWVLQHGALARAPDVRRLPVLPSIALLAAFLLATVLAPYPLVSVRELLNFLLLFAFLVLAADRLASRPERVRGAVTMLVAVAALSGVAALLETLDILPGQFPRTETRWFRAALGFGQPNALGLFLALSLPLAAHRLHVTRGAARSLAAFSVLAIALGLFGTFSRGAWLSVLAGTAVLFFARSGRYALRIWVVAFFGALVLDIVSGGALRDTAARTIDDWVIDQRAALMLAGVLMFLDHPLTGVGPGGYAESLDRYGAQIPQLWDYLPTPHNAYVQMAAEAGIVGLLAFVAFLAAVLWRALRAARRAAHGTNAEEASLRRALLWSVAVACCAGMVVWPFSHGTGQAAMFVFATCLAAEHA